MSISTTISFSLLSYLTVEKDWLVDAESGNFRFSLEEGRFWCRVDAFVSSNCLVSQLSESLTYYWSTLSGLVPQPMLLNEKLY